MLEIIEELDEIIEKSTEKKTTEEIEVVIDKVSKVIDDIEKKMTEEN